MGRDGNCCLLLSWLYALSHCHTVSGCMQAGAGFIQGPHCIQVHSSFPQFWPDSDEKLPKNSSVFVIRPEDPSSSHDLKIPLNAIWKPPSTLSYAFHSKWQSTIKAWLMQCCSDGRPFGKFSHFCRGLLEQTVKQKGLVVPNFFHTKWLRPLCFRENFKIQKWFYTFTLIFASQLCLSQRFTFSKDIQ